MIRSVSLVVPFDQTCLRPRRRPRTLCCRAARPAPRPACSAPTATNPVRFRRPQAMEPAAARQRTAPVLPPLRLPPAAPSTLPPRTPSGDELATLRGFGAESATGSQQHDKALSLAASAHARDGAACALSCVDVALLSHAFQARVPEALGGGCSFESLCAQSCATLGVAPADVQLFALQPLSPDAPLPAGCRVGVSLQRSTFSLAAVEELLREREQLRQAHAKAEAETVQLAEQTQRERDELRAVRDALAAAKHELQQERQLRLQTQAAYDELQERYAASTPSLLERLRLDGFGADEYGAADGVRLQPGALAALSLAERVGMGASGAAQAYATRV